MGEQANQLLSSSQLQPPSKKNEKLPIIFYVDLTSYARAADISALGEHGILAVTFSNIADFFHKLGLFSLGDFSRSLEYRLTKFLQNEGNSQPPGAILPCQTTCKDTSKSRPVVLYIHFGKKVALAQEAPPPKRKNSLKKFVATLFHTTWHHFLDLLHTPFLFQEKEFARLLYMLRRGQIKDVKLQLWQDVPLTHKQREILLSLAITGGYTNCVEFLLQKKIYVSDTHFKLAARYGRVHTARLLLKKKWNVNVLRLEAEYYGNIAIVQLVTKLPSKSSFQDKWNKIEANYNEEWRRVTSDILKIKDVQPLREFIVNNINFIHYQDHKGFTPLHVAAEQGHELCVRELLEHGALPNARTTDLKTPADLANSRGHWRIAKIIERKIQVKDSGKQSRKDVSKRYFRLLEAISKGGKIFANDIEDKAAKVELVKTVTSLLATGTPLEFSGPFTNSALLLAISTNRTPLLPLLLAAGAPLTATTSGLGPLQLALITPGVTPWVGVVVARAIRHKLKVEMDFAPENSMDQMLKSGISNLLQHLEGKEPWKAKFNSTKNNPEHLTQLLVTACKRGATTSAWWVWQAGGNPVSSVASTSALHAALNPERPHLDTARTLILHMGCNPFLPGEDGSLLFNNMPLEFRKQLLQDSLAREYRCLYMEMARARRHRNRKKIIDLQRLAVLQILLYIQYEMHSEEASYPFLQDLLTCSELELTGNQEEELHDLNEEWITSLIRKLDADCEGKTTLGKDEEDEFYELSECIRLFSRRKRKGSEYNIKHKHDCLDLLYKKALMMCSKENLTAFLYLLVSVAGVHVNGEVDPICGTQALHHAAMHGNLSIAMSLVCFGCSKEARDHGRNTPSHYAYMAGHKEVAQFLADGIENEVNNRKLRPRDMLKRYNTYLDQQSLTLVSSIKEEQEIFNDSKTLIELHLHHLRETWEAKGGLIKTVMDTHVDFTKNESLEVKQAITKVAEDLISEIAKVNKLFEGDLVGVGSAADDTRIFCPDEYDFNLVLRNISGHPGGGLKFELQKSPETELVQKHIELSAESSELENLMDGSNFTDTFYNIAKDCLKNLRIGDERLIFISPGIKNTQVGINLCMVWMGQEFPLLMIDVDIVPTVEAPWPQQHPRPPLTPSDMNTVYLSNTTRKEWRFSFGVAENQIMKKLTDHQRRVFLGCKLLLSSLTVSWWMPKETKKQFTFWDKRVFRLSVPAGFALKNVFFEELQDVQNANLWTDDHLLDRMKSVFSRMCEDPSDPECQMPRKVMAYFGGNTQLPSFALGAPDILVFLRSLDALPLQPSSKA
ncbi:uncharacterized protein LOC125045741 [Penaeus chinensis]|uniref:uncharacterized protein LOC125045741 n=1 Tax=Penaeus chinensis TaxID=139456 RepID=UPI001FB81AA1|nr:uncharacterized protein LOC125045741 [Penaeus chinensis]